MTMCQSPTRRSLGGVSNGAPMRIVVFILCLMLAALCGFGLLASFEPGVRVSWKLVYGAGVLLFLSTAVLAASRSRNSGL